MKKVLGIKPPQSWFWHIVGFVIGIVIGAMMVFNVFFLSKVLPHGGF